MGLSFESSQFASQRNIPDLEQLTGGVFDHIIFDSITRTDIEVEIRKRFNKLDGYDSH